MRILISDFMFIKFFKNKKSLESISLDFSNCSFQDFKQQLNNVKISSVKKNPNILLKVYKKAFK